MGDVWRGFFKFHGTHITENLSWTTNTHHMVKKAQQQLHFLRTLRILRKKHLDEKLLVSYCCTNESVLAYCISTWYGRLKIINTTQKITGCALPPLQDIISFRCPTRSANIWKDPSIWKTPSCPSNPIQSDKKKVFTPPQYGHWKPVTFTHSPYQSLSLCQTVALYALFQCYLTACTRECVQMCVWGCGDVGG